MDIKYNIIEINSNLDDEQLSNIINKKLYNIIDCMEMTRNNEQNIL